MIHYASGMATNTNTTPTPGTVKGTARVTTTELRPGMTIRFPGNRRQGRDARLATIASVTSELRSNGSSKRARWYVIGFTDGTGCDLAPATRHDVTADATGRPLVKDEPEPAPRTVAAETGPVLTLVLKDHTTQASLF